MPEPPERLADPDTNIKDSHSKSLNLTTPQVLLEETIIGFTFAETCFSALSLKGKDGSGRNLGTRVSACDLIFHDILL